LDPVTRDITVKNITLPTEYDLSTHQATCLMTPSGRGGLPLFVGYGGLPGESKGTESQPPTSHVTVMQLTVDGKPWSLQVVAGKGLPGRAAAAMACGPDGVAYIFGGLQDIGNGQVSKYFSTQYVPTNTLYRVHLSSSGKGYSLTAEQLKPTGVSPPARSQHILLYLPPGEFSWAGEKGSLLLHGGSNTKATEYTTEGITGPGLSSWFKVFNDAWLYDIASNRWSKLPARGAHPGLTWHAAAINQANGSSLGSLQSQVVLFGGITYENQTNMFGQEHAMFLLDEQGGIFEWRKVDLKLGPKDVNKVMYPNVAVAVAPEEGLMVLRHGKVCAG
jgi:hypothetical protein